MMARQSVSACVRAALVLDERRADMNAFGYSKREQVPVP